MMHNKWSSASDTQPAEASRMTSAHQKHHMDSNQEAYTTFNHSDPRDSQALPDPQQTELLHAMQNVTGRFIRNTIMQLRKRAADLCIEELKEYKRSKILNILEAPKQTQACHSRPSSASYLVPAVPSSYDTVNATQHSLPDSHTTQDVARQNPAQAQMQVSKAELSRNIATQQGLPCSPVRGSQGIPASMPPQSQALLSRHIQEHDKGPVPTQDMLVNLPDNAKSSRAKGDQQLFDSAATARSGDLDLQCSSASISLDGSASDSQPSAGKLEVQLPSQQIAYRKSWCQSTSQPVVSGNEWLHVPSQPAMHFSPAKLACTPSFSFSKQPCPVMW